METIYPIVPTFDRTISPPKGWLSLERFRRLMKGGMWNFFLQYINYTRSYENGFQLAWILLRMQEEYQRLLTEKENETILVQVYSLLLNMLDKLDRWVDFLNAFDQLKTHTRLSTSGYYSNESRDFHLKRGAAPYILGDMPGGFKMNFLYYFERRRILLNKKLMKRRSGQKIGNLYHGTQEQLSPEELQRRIDWLFSWLDDQESRNANDYQHEKSPFERLE